MVNTSSIIATQSYVGTAIGNNPSNFANSTNGNSIGGSAAQLAGFTWVSPGWVGYTTANNGNFVVLSATGNITAFASDERLKENIYTISNALDKVSKIRGISYNMNELASTFGYDPTKKYVGVIAQEVQKVLPEVVVPAPFDVGYDEEGNSYSKSGDNYLTVQYDKIVPLLIEAIKELKMEVEGLRRMVNRR